MMYIFAGAFMYLKNPYNINDFYPLEYPISYYPEIIYDKVVDSYEYTKTLANDGAYELSDYWFKVKEYSNEALDSLWQNSTEV